MPKIAHPSPTPREPKTPHPLADGFYVFAVTLRVVADPAFLGEDLSQDELNAAVLKSIGYSPFLKSVDIVGN